MLHACIDNEFKRLQSEKEKRKLTGYESGVYDVFKLLSYYEDDSFLESCIRSYILKYNVKKHILSQYEISGTEEYRADYQRGIVETLRKLYLTFLLNEGYLDINTIDKFVKNR